MQFISPVCPYLPCALASNGTNSLRIKLRCRRDWNKVSISMGLLSHTNSVCPPLWRTVSIGPRWPFHYIPTADQTTTVLCSLSENNTATPPRHPLIPNLIPRPVWRETPFSNSLAIDTRTGPSIFSSSVCKFVSKGQFGINPIPLFSSARDQCRWMVRETSMVYFLSFKYK